MGVFLTRYKDFFILLTVCFLFFQNCSDFHGALDPMASSSEENVVPQSDCENRPKLEEQKITIRSDGRYHHFGMITKDKGGKLHSVYRSGDDHYSVGRIFYQKSIDNGLSWSVPVEISSPTADALRDYRDPNIGITNNGILIIPYVLKTIIDPNQPSVRSTSWKYKFSSNDGLTWSEELTLDESLGNGLPYGRPFAIPGVENEIVFSGYYASHGNYTLANWKGVFKNEDGILTVNWEELPPIIVTNGGRYEYAEHSVTPISSTHWFAVSRGEDSINLFETQDGGQTWAQLPAMLDIAEDVENAFHALVAPMLDTITLDSQSYLLMLYTKRFNSPDSATAFYRIGKVPSQEGEVINWSEPTEITQYTNKLSGYQSGVFLHCQNLKFYHLSFNEKNFDRTRADVEGQIIDLSRFEFNSL